MVRSHAVVAPAVVTVGAASTVQHAAAGGCCPVPLASPSRASISNLTFVVFGQRAFALARAAGGQDGVRKEQLKGFCYKVA